MKALEFLHFIKRCNERQIKNAVDNFTIAECSLV